jgi:hypothetical protein
MIRKKRQNPIADSIFSSFHQFGPGEEKGKGQAWWKRGKECFDCFWLTKDVSLHGLHGWDMHFSDVLADER